MWLAALSPPHPHSIYPLLSWCYGTFLMAAAAGGGGERADLRRGVSIKGITTTTITTPPPPHLQLG